MTFGSNATLHRAARHSFYVAATDISKCYFMSDFDDYENFACKYVSSSPGCTQPVRLFNYLYFMVCTLHLQKNVWGIIYMTSISFAILALYITFLFLMAKYFFVPNAITIARRFNMTSFDFGLVFIAIALCLPDTIDSFRSCARQTEMGSLMLAKTFGKIITCFCVGMVVLSFKRMYSMQPGHGIITFLALIASISTIVLVMKFKQHENKLNIRVCAAVILIVYVAYLSYSVILVHKGRPLSRVTLSRASRFIVPYVKSEDKIDKKWNDYLYTMNPREHIPNLNIVQCILLLPIWVLLSHLIPVVEARRKFDGWCKFPACVAVFIFPIAFGLFYISFATFFVMFFISCILVSLIGILTKPMERPTHHYFFAIHGFLACTVFYCIIDLEIDVLTFQYFNYLCNIDSDGLSILTQSWIYTLLEAVVVETLIKNNLAHIAFGVVTGITMFLSYTILPTLVFKPCFDPTQEIVITANTFTTFIFCLLIFIYTLLNVSLVNYQLRYSYGIYILIVFGFFVLYLVLSLAHVVHTYGAKHSVLISKDGDEDLTSNSVFTL